MKGRGLGWGDKLGWYPVMVPRARWSRRGSGPDGSPRQEDQSKPRYGPNSVGLRGMVLRGMRFSRGWTGATGELTYKGDGSEGRLVLRR